MLFVNRFEETGMTMELTVPAACSGMSFVMAALRDRQCPLHEAGELPVRELPVRELPAKSLLCKRRGQPGCWRTAVDVVYSVPWELN